MAASTEEIVQVLMLEVEKLQISHDKMRTELEKLRRTVRLMDSGTARLTECCPRQEDNNDTDTAQMRNALAIVLLVLLLLYIAT